MHDLAVAGRKGGQVEVGRRGGGVDMAGCVADMGCGGVRIDVALEQLNRSEETEPLFIYIFKQKQKQQQR